MQTATPNRPAPTPARDWIGEFVALTTVSDMQQMSGIPSQQEVIIERWFDARRGRVSWMQAGACLKLIGCVREGKLTTVREAYR